MVESLSKGNPAWKYLFNTTRKLFTGLILLILYSGQRLTLLHPDG